MTEIHGSYYLIVVVVVELLPGDNDSNGRNHRWMDLFCRVAKNSKILSFERSTGRLPSECSYGTTHLVPIMV
jgi:hypothetical protein